MNFNFEKLLFSLTLGLAFAVYALVLILILSIYIGFEPNGENDVLFSQIGVAFAAGIAHFSLSLIDKYNRTGRVAAIALISIMLLVLLIFTFKTGILLTISAACLGFSSGHIFAKHSYKIAVYQQDFIRTVKKYLPLITSMLAIYFLFIASYGILYYFLEHFNSHSFFCEQCKDGIIGRSAFFYFSLVTFSTTGFGDIIPKNDIARLAVASEVFLGSVIFVIYLAVILSKLTHDEKDISQSLEEKEDVK